MWMTLMIVASCVFIIICIWSALEVYFESRKRRKRAKMTEI